VDVTPPEKTIDVFGTVYKLLIDIFVVDIPPTVSPIPDIFAEFAEIILDTVTFVVEMPFVVIPVEDKMGVLIKPLACKVVVEIPTAVAPAPDTRKPFATVYKVDHDTFVVEIPLAVIPCPCTVIPFAVSKLLVDRRGVTI
jgi:hypothetical protein